MLTSTGIVASAENTNISYTVGAVYTVTIPSDVTLRDTDYTDYIKAEGATAGSVPVLDEGKKIKVKLTGAKNGFNGTNLTVKQSDSAKATYTLIGKDNTPVAQNGTVAEFTFDPTKGTDYYKQAIIFTAPQGAGYSGTYTDVLPFTVSVE